MAIGKRKCRRCGQLGHMAKTCEDADAPEPGPAKAEPRWRKSARAWKALAMIYRGRWKTWEDEAKYWRSIAREGKP